MGTDVETLNQTVCRDCSLQIPLSPKWDVLTKSPPPGKGNRAQGSAPVTPSISNPFPLENSSSLPNKQFSPCLWTAVATFVVFCRRGSKKIVRRGGHGDCLPDTVLHGFKPQRVTLLRGGSGCGSHPYPRSCLYQDTFWAGKNKLFPMESHRVHPPYSRAATGQRELDSGVSVGLHLIFLVSFFFGPLFILIPIFVGGVLRGFLALLLLGFVCFRERTKLGK